MHTHHAKCKSRGKIIVFHVLAGLLMAFIFGLIFGFFVMLLWNYLLPDIFGLKAITFWQGVSLVVLCRLLFGTRGYGYGHHVKKYHATKKNIHYQTWWETEGKEALEKYIDQRSSAEK